MCANIIQILRPPRRCRLCHTELPAGQLLCTACHAALPHQAHACPRCALPLDDRIPAGRLCGECLADPPPFDRVIAPYRYRDPLNDLVSRFKYHRGLSDGRLLAHLLGKHVERTGLKVELLLPMPLHAARLRQRGFNQAAEMTRVLSRLTSLPWRTDILLRSKAGASQREASKRDRLRNVRSAFQCSSGKGLPTRVAVIDDVITTGATARAAAACLKKAGVQWVEIWAVARTPRPGSD